MQKSPSTSRSPTFDSSSEDLDDIEICIDHEFSDLDDFSATEPPKKPHFLDYDYENHADIENLTTPKTMTTSAATAAVASTVQDTNSLGRDSCYPGEQIKVDKRLERDGEISDYELIATNSKKLYKKESAATRSGQRAEMRTKKKHFLDENPVPPAGEQAQKYREHRSLDRTFDRTIIDEFAHLKYERKHSLDRELPKRRTAGIKSDHNYTLARYIESFEAPAMDGAFHGGTWPAEQHVYPPDMKFASLPSSVLHTNGSSNDLGPKVECVYSLLSMLGSHDSLEMSSKFLELSKNRETCAALRRSGCIPLLVQIMHSDPDYAARKRAGQALHNVVHCHPDDKAGRREARVLRLIEQLIEYCDSLRERLAKREAGGVENELSLEDDRHPIQAIGTLMKTSFDEEHRHAMCQLGALQTISNLVQLDHACHGGTSSEPNQNCITLRRYAGMTLTNLTFGDGNNKALLCSNKGFMQALVRQIESQSDELVQVTASVLRNLSWRADSNMKAVLNEIGTVKILTMAAMRSTMENTLKAILSALWNLSNHCPTNKAEFCEVDGAIEFLIAMLNYDAPSKTMAVIENAGGILRNVSSHLATKEEYRKRLRQKNCFSILLHQLKSPSLTVVSNACGTLGNLSANCFEDQKFLRDNGAIPMLRSLIYSKHKMISTGSTIALKHLLNSNKSGGIPGGSAGILDSVTKSMDLKELPSLNVRKQRALEQELDQNLSVPRSCSSSSGSDDLLILTSTGKHSDENAKGKPGLNRRPLSASASGNSVTAINKSDSRDSLLSAKSDSMFEKMQRQKQNGTAELAKERTTRSNEFIETSVQEQPIDYSLKFKQAKPPKSSKVQVFGDYQETDLDQPTDYSLRYAENQDLDSDEDDEEDAVAGAVRTVAISEKRTTQRQNVLMLEEDSIKCYYTEGTPRIISNATSMSDLRKEKVAAAAEKPNLPEGAMLPPRTLPIMIEKVKKEHVTFGSGTQSPEKPINYCEEGTPGVFSRYDSLNSLIDTVDLNPGNVTETVKVSTDVTRPIQEGDERQTLTPPLPKDTFVAAGVSQPITAPTTPGGSKSVTFIDFAQETPLMFSRTSSIGSLASAEPFGTDDKSSVVSEFSRLASGILSPSEVPDSPTQSIPQSPRRTTMMIPSNRAPPIAAPRLRSVFEDNVNSFGVENTPMQFSCATSLSNLSLDDEPKITTDTLTKEMRLMNHPSEDREDQEEQEDPPAQLSDVENEESLPEPPTANDSAHPEDVLTDGEESANDVMLLESCINIGMNRGRQADQQRISNNDSFQQYCTEDTPALLSKTGSNTNLSILSLDTNKGETVLSDDSSNTSDAGNDELLKECIQVGMPKPSSSSVARNMMSLPQQGVGNSQKPKPKERRTINLLPQQMSMENPIDKMRSGGGFGAGGLNVAAASAASTSMHHHLPPYLPVKDEMNKFLVEDSPCNFSVMSALSDLTVGSGVAGLTKMKRSPPTDTKLTQNSKYPQPSHSAIIHQPPAPPSHMKQPKQPTYDDSLSSLSIESEGEDLMTQAIAAGFNATRPGKSKDSYEQAKSNNAAAYRTTQQNDSLSSVGSSCDLNQDDDDQQANSLLQQCIQSGINSVVGGGHATTFMMQSPKRSQLPIFDHHPPPSHKPVVTAKSPSKAAAAVTSKDIRHKERQRKDEQLLKEIINNGIAGTTNVESNMTPMRHFSMTTTAQPRQILQPTVDLTNRLANLTITASVEPPTTSNMHYHHQNIMQNIPKNEKSTSVVVVSDQEQQQNHTTSRATIINHNHTIYTGVESMELQNGVNGNNDTINNKNNSNISNNNSITLSSPVGTRKNGVSYHPTHCDQSNHQNGYDEHHNLNITSNNTSCNDNILERSNEYPALQMSCSQFTFTDDESETVDRSIHHLNEHSSTSQIMELSNEFLIEQSMTENGDCFDGNVMTSSSGGRKIMAKHKDPDLMLQSVERLTQELVSTAEYLRTSNNDGNNEDDTTTTTSSNVLNNMTNNNIPTLLEASQSQNHTWEEDTCPNDDVSFPSLSVTAPMITSIEDDNTFSEFNFRHNGVGTAMFDVIEDLEEPTPTNETKTFMIGSECGARSTGGSELRDTREKAGIQFQVGGEVCTSSVAGASLQYLSSGSGPYSFDNSSTTLTNSTMIAFEANRLANDFDCFAAGMVDSTTSLDLDNIRPPSAMDCISLSTMTTAGAGGSCSASPQMSRKVFRKKSLPSGLIAKRALLAAASSNNMFSQFAMGGSVESINSMNNLMLDNIKPPSIMDELMDSMISVESITSEIADNNLLTTATSHYETAMGDLTLNDDDDDDNTTTLLQSCYTDFQFPIDGIVDNCTPIPSDFSSAESTPVRKVKNIKKLMTPRQKRKMEKTRFRTYTIAADRALQERVDEINGRETDEQISDDEQEPEEILRVVEEKGSSDGSPSPARRLTPRQKRQEDRGRFETQILDPLQITGSPSSLSDHSRESPKRSRQQNPERFKTQTIEHTEQTEPEHCGMIDPATYSIDDDTITDQLPTDLDCLSLLSNETIYDDDDEDRSIRAMTENFKYIREVKVLAPPLASTTAQTTASYIKAVQKMMIGNAVTETTVAVKPVSEVVAVVKPRIVKPTEETREPDETNVTGDEEEHTPKAVRGRKKPAYVSPYRKAVSASPQQRHASPKSASSIIPRSNLSAKSVSPSPPASALKKSPNSSSKILPKNQTIVAKTHVFINKANYLTKKVVSNVKPVNGRPPTAGTPGKPRNGMTVAEKNSVNAKNGLVNGRPKSGGAVAKTIPAVAAEPIVAPPQRQGTFIKEEPSHPELPVVVSAPPTPSKSRLPSKIPASKPTASANAPLTPTAASSKSPFVSKLRIPLQKSSSLSSDAKKLGGTTPARIPADTMAATKSRNFSVYKSPSVPSVPMRSNSNASIKLNAKQRNSLSVAPGRSNTTIIHSKPAAIVESSPPPPGAPPKKDITSRISSIWKKIDENKKKQELQKKDNRVWIARTNGTTKTEVDGAATAEMPPPPAPLIRSSTFDSSPPQSAVLRSPSSNNVTHLTGGAILMRKTKDNMVNGNELKRISRLGSFVNVEGEF